MLVLISSADSLIDGLRTNNRIRIIWSWVIIYLHWDKKFPLFWRHETCLDYIVLPIIQNPMSKKEIILLGYLSQILHFFHGEFSWKCSSFLFDRSIDRKACILKKEMVCKHGKSFYKSACCLMISLSIFLPSSVLIFARRVSCPICNRISLPDSLHCWEQSLVKKLFVFLWTFLFRSIHRASHNLPLILIWSINKAYFYPVMEVARKRWDEYGITTSAPVTLPQNNGYYRWVVYIVNDKR